MEGRLSLKYILMGHSPEKAYSKINFSGLKIIERALTGQMMLWDPVA
jgi:hypothetical protein